MVGIIKALGSGKAGGGAADAARYFTTADYYAKGGEPLGQWHGEGAKLLGLRGAPNYETLLAVLSGCHPVTRQSLIPVRKPKRTVGLDEGSRTGNEPDRSQRKRRERCPAIDLCLTLPEDLTIAWAVGGPKVRQAIDEAVDAASKRLITYIEEKFPLARRGLHGVEQQQAKLVVALFDHGTSRAVDPQPHRHRHCVIANLCQGEDGRWSAINTRMLFDWTRALGPVYRCLVTAELSKRIQLPLRPAVDANGRLRGWAEIAGVPELLRKLWSSRHDEIEEFVAGDKRLTGLATTNAKAAAQIKTRQAKRQQPPHSELHATWESEGRKHGFGPEQIEAMLGRPNNIDHANIYPQALRQAMAELTQSEAHFTRQQLIQRTAELLSHTGVDGLEVIERIDRDLRQSPEIVRLTDHEGDLHYSTPQMWALEKKLLADTDVLLRAEGAKVSQKTIDRVLAQRTTATEEQKQAVAAILRSTAQIRTLTGVAGSGKTFVLDTVREALERAGYRVIGGALSGIAKEELAAQANIKSRTVASYLHHLDRAAWDRVKDIVRHHTRQLVRAARGLPTYGPSKVTIGKKHVLILDEAGMLDTHTMSRCLHHAKKSGATVLVVGDTKQLSPIDAGGPFRRLVGIIKGPHLGENRRQRHAVDRQAVTLLREGQGAKALELYAEAGRLTIGKNKLDTLRKLVAHWAETGGVKQPQDHLILTQTRREAQALNLRCQRERQAQRKVAQHGGVRVAEGYIYRGDRVLFHKSYRAAGVENGHQGTVLSVNPLTRRITVRLDHWVPTGRDEVKQQPVVVIPLRALQKDAIGLAYAATTHKMQGRTVAKALILLSGKLVDRALAYVQATRAKETSHFFVDQLHAGETLRDLAQAVSRSRDKLLAHDLGKPSRDKSRLPTLEIER